MAVKTNGVSQAHAKDRMTGRQLICNVPTPAPCLVHPRHHRTCCGRDQIERERITRCDKVGWRWREGRGKCYFHIS